MSNSIRTVIFPVAGRGTRFLPATKASPKEMLPIVDKPLIQYAVEEAIAAGAEKLVFVTGSSKRAIEDHFDRDHELELELEAKGKQDLLDTIHRIVPDHVTCMYVRQSAPLGLGHAVLCGKELANGGPFFVHLADDLIYAKTACLEQMRQVYEKTGASVIAVETVPADQTDKYGIVSVEDIDASYSRISAIVEKPKPDDAPSTLAVVGRYLLSPTIFEKLATTSRGAGGEIQLTDAISDLLADEEIVAYRFEGKRYDCGSKLGYLEATVEFGLRHHQFGDEFARYLKNLISDS